MRGVVFSCTFPVFEHPACLACIGKHPVHALSFVKASGVKLGLVLSVVFLVVEALLWQLFFSVQHF